MWTWARPGRGGPGVLRGRRDDGEARRSAGRRGEVRSDFPPPGPAGPRVGVALCYLPVWYGGRERGNCEVFSKVASEWGGCWHYVRSYSHSSNLPMLEFGLERS